MRLTWMLVLLVACKGGAVNTEADAELAYTGLDDMIGKAMGLGFDGFNAADSANIDEQAGTGDVSGTVAVNGQVDQGNSDNKNMRLTVALAEYSDTVLINDDEDELTVTYWTTEGSEPALDLTLRSIPDGTLEGTMSGSFDMEGDLEDTVTLELTLAGPLEADDGDDDDATRRVAGQTTITGTATTSAGTFDVNLTR